MTVMASGNENFPSSSHIPRPHQSTTVCPDPQLGLTPERTSPLSNRKSVRFVSPDKPRAKRQVVMPPATGKENTGLASINLPLEDIRGSKQQRHKLETKTRHGKVKVKEREHRSTDNSSEGPHLDTPELHTTLNIGRDILHLQSMSIDVVEAVKHRLTVSEQDRMHVKQKTFSKLNERPKSPGIIADALPLNIPADAVVGQSECQLSKCVKSLPARPKPTLEKPSLNKHMREDLVYHRCVSLDQHGYQPSALHLPLPNIDQAAFEHHHRITQWQLR